MTTLTPEQWNFVQSMQQQQNPVQEQTPIEKTAQQQPMQQNANVMSPDTQAFIAEQERRKALDDERERLFAERRKEASGEEAFDYGMERVLKSISHGTTKAIQNIKDLGEYSQLLGPQGYLQGAKFLFGGEQPLSEDFYKKSMNKLTNLIPGMGQGPRLPEAYEQVSGFTPENLPEEIISKGTEFGIGSFMPGQATNTKDVLLSLGSGAASAIGKNVAGTPGEIIGGIGPSLVSTGVNIFNNARGTITSKVNSVRDYLNSLEKQGYSDQVRTFVKNQLEDRGLLTTISKSTKDVRARFTSVKNELHGMVTKIREEGLGSITRESLEKGKSALWDNVKQYYGNLEVPNPKSLVKPIERRIKKLESLAHDPTGKRDELINHYKETVKRLKGETKQGSPKRVNWYLDEMKQLSSEKWVGNAEALELNEEVKNAILNHLVGFDTSPGKEMSNSIIRTREAYYNASAAVRADDVVSKAFTDGNLDVKKLGKILQNNKDVDTLTKSLGTENVKRLKEIQNVGNLVNLYEKNFPKKAYQGHIWNIGKYIFHHDYKALVGKSLKEGAIYLTQVESAQRITNRLLTDPNFQRMTLNFYDSVRKNRPGRIQPQLTAIQNYIQKLGREEEKKNKKS